MKPLSRTIVCPRCGAYATVTERTDDGDYKVRCTNDGDVLIGALEERKAKSAYTKRMKREFQSDHDP
jgi:thymidine kinase